jgi:hypothetical protein
MRLVNTTESPTVNCKFSFALPTKCHGDAISTAYEKKLLDVPLKSEPDSHRLETQKKELSRLMGTEMTG